MEAETLMAMCMMILPLCQHPPANSVEQTELYVVFVHPKLIWQEAFHETPMNTDLFQSNRWPACAGHEIY